MLKIVYGNLLLCRLEMRTECKWVVKYGQLPITEQSLSPISENITGWLYYIIPFEHKNLQQFNLFC